MVSRRVERLEAAQKKNPDHMLDEEEEWARIHIVLIKALKPFPEAKLAVAEAPRKLNTYEGHGST